MGCFFTRETQLNELLLERSHGQGGETPKDEFMLKYDELIYHDDDSDDEIAPESDL